MIKDTPQSLCDSCRYIQRAKKKGSNDVVYDCGNPDAPYYNTVYRSRHGLPPIEACSGYLRKGAMTLNEMQRTAWLLNTDPKRPIGFAPPGSDMYKEIEKEQGGRWNRRVDGAELMNEPD